MKRKRMLMRPALTGLLILILAATAGCTTVASSPGQVELSATEFDFGTIPNTEAVSQVFQVRNVGQGWLEITGVSTSCGCTTAEVDSLRLAAGETADLTVTYDPRTHEGATGEFMRVVYLRSNDPDAPEVTLTIRVTVVEPGRGSEGPTASSAEVAQLYKMFVCPCCGQDIGSCTCGMAEERRGFIDQHLAYGASTNQVHRAMFQAYGAGAFFYEGLAAQVRTELAETLPAERPVLVVEPLMADLGTIPIAGGPVRTTFVVRNRGQSDLTITGLQTSCACTTAVLETAHGTSPVFSANPSENAESWSATLAPGEDASLVVTFDPMAHGPEATGEIRRVISISSSDPLDSRLDVAFEVKVT
ncbi:MAG: DUF1573 domain-containing protein [Chloroflexi bacterium]|nr:DUF1573 domain-containing protein [Chloroflexota bacterium]